jgi:hypothetical protein
LVDTTQAPSDEKRTVDFLDLLQNSNADLSKVWQYRLWSFQGWDTKVERVWAKN